MQSIAKNTETQQEGYVKNFTTKDTGYVLYSPSLYKVIGENSLLYDRTSGFAELILAGAVYTDKEQAQGQIAKTMASYPDVIVLEVEETRVLQHRIPEGS